MILYNIPGRCVVNMGPDLLAELAQIDGIEAVKQANSDELQPIDGLAVLAGNDDILAANLDQGGAGGICVASHIVGNEMRRHVRRAGRRARRSTRALRDVYATLFLTSSPTCTKAALNLLGHDVGGCRLPMVEADEHELDEVQADARSATGCSNGPPPRERHPARPPARGARRDRQEHVRRRVRRPHRRRRRAACGSRPRR